METSVTPFTYGELYRQRYEEVKNDRLRMNIYFIYILALFCSIFS